MSTIPLDIIKYLAEFLSVVDIINVGLTCRDLHSKILDRDDIWFTYIITNWPITIPPAYHGLRHTIEWKRLMFEYKTRMKIATQLMKVHIRQRFEIPQSSKQYFRLFYEVKSSDPRVPTKILNGVEIKEEDSALHMRFTHKDGSIIFWRGEGDIQSNDDIYLVDRSSPTVKIYIGGSFIYSYYERHTSLLSKKQYREIGQLLYNDPNYYGGESSISYNHSTEHGYHRAGAPTGFGSNTKSHNMPTISAKCLTHVDVTYNTIELYRAMIAEKN
jgi:hypothetical protein